jgi:processive 1,2-diacylglycerol beta-glucosyltransferase
MYQATLFDLWRHEYKYSAKHLSDKSGIALRSVNYALKEYKDKLKTLKKIIVLNKPYGSRGVQYHRILKPYTKLAEYSDRLNIEIVPEYTNQPCHYLVFNRTCAQQVIGHYENIINAKAQGTKVVLDLDDYWNLPESHTLFGQYRDLNIPAMTEKTISMVDIVTTSNHVLAEKIKEINPNVHIIRNVIDLEEKQWQSKSKINEKSPVFGWVCSGAHTSDLAEVSLLAKRQFTGELRKIRTHLAGYSPKASAMRTIAEAMTFNGKLKRENIGLSPFIAVTEYANHYNYIDVAIAPLANLFFNTCKSELKILEAGAKGLPIIVSDVYPYNTFSEDMVYIAKTPNDFCNTVKHISQNMTEAKAKAEKLHCHIKENWTYKNETPCLEKVFI